MIGVVSFAASSNRTLAAGTNALVTTSGFNAAFDTTATHVFRVLATWSAADPGNIVDLRQAFITKRLAAAVKALGWAAPHFLDADHIRLETVGRFLPHCDFYTIDVADFIGQPAAPEAVEAFLARHPELVGRQVVAVVNFPRKQIGPLMSECLVTGFHDADGAVRLCVPDQDVPLGTRLL